MHFCLFFPLNGYCVQAFAFFKRPNTLNQKKKKVTIIYSSPVPASPFRIVATIFVFTSSSLLIVFSVSSMVVVGGPDVWGSAAKRTKHSSEMKREASAWRQQQRGQSAQELHSFQAPSETMWFQSQSNNIAVSGVVEVTGSQRTQVNPAGSSCITGKHLLANPQSVNHHSPKTPKHSDENGIKNV